MPPTDKNYPWRLSLRQTDLEPITVAIRIVSSPKTCEAGLTSPGHRIVKNPVVAHAAGSHSPRWEVAQRSSKSNIETWTLSTVQEKKINTFYQRCFCCILIIRWQHKITYKEVLKRTSLTAMYNTLSQRRLGHVSAVMRIPKTLSYSELIVGKRNFGQPRLR